MMRARICALLILFATSSAPAGAQQTTPSPAPPQPLVLERIHDAFVVAPDYKVTNIDDRFGQLAGVYAARVMDEHLLVGGAIYWLADPSTDVKLTYGGLLIGWSVGAGNHVRFGARSLVGVGSATLGTDVTPVGRGLTRFGASRSTASPTTIRVVARDDFAMVEPQVTVLTRFTDHIAIDTSVGYRVTALDEVFGDRLDGVTGSVALQFGW